MVEGPVSNCFSSPYPHSSDTIYLPGNTRDCPSICQGTKYLVYFITGNPGLIQYYDEFLRHLHRKLNEACEWTDVTGKPSFTVFGRSLQGFQLSERPTGGVLDLEGQIRSVQDSLHYVTSWVGSRHRKTAKEDARHDGLGPVKVVLIGHSVGTYILLELIQRAKKKNETLLDKRFYGAERTQEADEIVTYLPDFIGGICLFPTITHLADSPTGRKVAVRKKLSYKNHSISSCLSNLCSYSI